MNWIRALLVCLEICLRAWHCILYLHVVQTTRERLLTSSLTSLLTRQGVRCECSWLSICFVLSVTSLLAATISSEHNSMKLIACTFLIDTTCVGLKWKCAKLVTFHYLDQIFTHMLFRIANCFYTKMVDISGRLWLVHSPLSNALLVQPSILSFVLNVSCTEDEGAYREHRTER